MNLTRTIITSDLLLKHSGVWEICSFRLGIIQDACAELNSDCVLFRLRLELAFIGQVIKLDFCQL